MLYWVKFKNTEKITVAEKLENGDWRFIGILLPVMQSDTFEIFCEANYELMEFTKDLYQDWKIRLDICQDILTKSDLDYIQMKENKAKELGII